MEIGISIVICCYNSGKRLPDTIKHLSSLKFPESFKYEIIIVNNASKDKTSDVAFECLSRYFKKNQFEIIDEPTPGLTYARKSGACVARYEWLLYCDDDNWLNANYIIQFGNILEMYPTLTAIGCGISEAVYEIQPPYWFLKYQHLCAVFNLENEKVSEKISSGISQDYWLCGAGLYIKKEIILDYYNEDGGSLLPGRTGKNLISGDDNDILWFVLKKNHTIGQFSSLKLSHFIPKERTTKDYIIKLSKAMSFSVDILTYKKYGSVKFPSFLFFLRYLFKQIIKVNTFEIRKTVSDYYGKIEAYLYLKKIE